MTDLPDETTIRYYFEGDPSLPFHLADFDSQISVLAEDRKDRLMEWLGIEVVINGTIEAGVTVSGPAYIGSGSVIHTGAEIQGPVYIGDNCSVRHGALVRSGTILGEGCVVGHDAEVKNSLCMSGSKMQSGVFVGDSVLGRGARLGSGTILANRRFSQDLVSIKVSDKKLATGVQFFGALIGDYARLGANVVTAPGTVVGPYTWVASLVSLQGFVPRAKLVLLKQELEYRDKEETVLRTGRGEYEST
jgi:UDP-N-acetylglucosamine diphosphorylase / glucose-1-phosphate thymidylyltransferase / UDP-N-acetylgalactosamine diphosphorylase / glucosamine-1-phosphate N-acetyltransferase / galactosamine-1-phosphate N-acetyltransferase